MINMLPNEQLRQERQRRGWSRQYVAEQIGVADPKTIGRWERGVASPSSYFLQKLCTLFGMLAQDLGLYPAEQYNLTHSPTARPKSDVLKVSTLHGQGQSSLARDNQAERHYSDGILWVSLRLRSNVSDLLGKWDSLLGLPANETWAR